MKTKFLVLTGLLLALVVFLSGCATGLTASGWPGMTAMPIMPILPAVLTFMRSIWRLARKSGVFPKRPLANPFDARPVLTSDGQLIVGGYDKKLYSLNPQTGQSNWQFTECP